MEETNLKKKTITSLIWKLLERFGARLVQFIVGIVIARILMPEDYGAVALITVFIVAAQVFTESGFSSALIRKLDADELDYSSVFWLSLLVSVILYLILFFVAPLIADFYKMPVLKDALRVLSLMIIIGTYNSMQNTILQKKLLFKKLFISSFSSVVLSGVLGIVFAYLGFGIWALVFQQLSALIITTIVMCFTVKWHPKFIFSFKRVRKLFSFGWKLLFSGILTVIYDNLYSLIIGKVYSPDDLAYWNRGKQFPDIIVGNINGAIMSVMYPVYSLKQNNKAELKAVVRRSMKVSSYLVFPLMVGLAVVAEPLVKLLLTDKWLPCVPFLQMWCIMYAFMPIHTTNLQVYNALGRSDVFLALDIIKEVTGIAVLFITLPYGLMTMIYARLGMSLVNTFVNAYPNKKILGYTIFEQFKDLLPTILLSGVMGGIVYGFGYIPINYIAVLVIEVFVGILVYVVLSMIFKPEAYVYCVNILKKGISQHKNKKSNKVCDKNKINTTQVNSLDSNTNKDIDKETNMKKILLLGGSAQQIVAIQKAKELGYYTILCDYLKDNPGQYYADKFYLASTTDKELILDIATKENINGIIAYASDPAAPTAAYVSEKLNLPSNPFWAVEMFSNKDKFREFLSKNNFCVPKCFNVDGCDFDQSIDKLKELKMPVMIKPVDSSGSKGITKINSIDEYETAYNYALSFSRSKKIQVEEFIEKDHPFLIGGDIIVNNGKIEIFGTMNCHRNNDVNPLVPIGKSYPCTLSEDRVNIMHKELQRLIDVANIKFGAFNIELVFDKDDKMYIIDMGARSGGNMIPQLMSYIFNVDIVEVLLKMAMGEDVKYDITDSKKYVCSYNLASNKTGELKNIEFDEKIENKIFMKNIYKKPGDAVEYFDYSAKLLGIIFVQLDSEDEVNEFYNNLDANIKIFVEE